LFVLFRALNRREVPGRGSLVGFGGPSCVRAERSFSRLRPGMLRAPLGKTIGIGSRVHPPLRLPKKNFDSPLLPTPAYEAPPPPHTQHPLRLIGYFLILSAHKPTLPSRPSSFFSHCLTEDAYFSHQLSRLPEIDFLLFLPEGSTYCETFDGKTSPFFSL